MTTNEWQQSLTNVSWAPQCLLNKAIVPSFLLEYNYPQQASGAHVVQACQTQIIMRIPSVHAPQHQDLLQCIDTHHISAQSQVKPRAPLNIHNHDKQCNSWEMYQWVFWIEKEEASEQSMAILLVGQSLTWDRTPGLWLLYTAETWPWAEFCSKITYQLEVVQEGVVDNTQDGTFLIDKAKGDVTEWKPVDNIGGSI